MKTKLRTSTLLWGLFILAIGVIQILVGLGFHLDLVIVGISILCALGVGLIVSPLLQKARRKDE